MASPSHRAPPNSLDNRTMEQFLLELSISEHLDEQAPKEVYSCDSCNGRCFEVFATTIAKMQTQRFCSADCYKKHIAKFQKDDMKMPKPRSPEKPNRDFLAVPFEKSKPIDIPNYAKKKGHSRSHNKCLQEARAASAPK